MSRRNDPLARAALALMAAPVRPLTAQGGEARYVPGITPPRHHHNPECGTGLAPNPLTQRGRALPRGRAAFEHDERHGQKHRAARQPVA